MPIGVGRLIRGARGVGRGVAQDPSRVSKGLGMGMLVGGAAIAGALSGSKQVMDSAFDVAFNDPEADRAFVGADITPAMAAGMDIGGPIGAFQKARLYGGASQVAGGLTAAAGGIGLGALGLGVGATGMAANIGLKRMNLGFGPGSMGGPNLFPKASYGGAIAAVGGIGLALAGAKSTAAGMQTFAGNPFLNTSSATADRLNASGDIVLGAHNSRRGY
jgi:hypothetical protein